MKLDNRINSLSDILTCVNIEEAKQFIGQMGYFADKIDLFDNLNERLYGALEAVVNNDLSFRSHGGVSYWRYFIPECRLKPAEKEKRYKPFDPETFEQHYGIGSVIKYRRKDEKHITYKAIVQSRVDNEDSKEVYFVIRKYSYTLDELFKYYEICEYGEWKPFGVEVQNG